MQRAGHVRHIGLSFSCNGLRTKDQPRDRPPPLAKDPRRTSIDDEQHTPRRRLEPLNLPGSVHTAAYFPGSVRRAHMLRVDLIICRAQALPAVSVIMLLRRQAVIARGQRHQTKFSASARRHRHSRSAVQHGGSSSPRHVRKIWLAYLPVFPLPLFPKKIARVPPQNGRQHADTFSLRPRLQPMASVRCYHPQ